MWSYDQFCSFYVCGVTMVWKSRATCIWSSNDWGGYALSNSILVFTLLIRAAWYHKRKGRIEKKEHKIKFQHVKPTGRHRSGTVIDSWVWCALTMTQASATHAAAVQSLVVSVGNSTQPIKMDLNNKLPFNWDVGILSGNWILQPFFVQSHSSINVRKYAKSLAGNLAALLENIEKHL